MKRRIVVSAAVALGFAAVAFGTAGASTQRSAGKSVTFHLVEKGVGFNFVDNPPRQGPNAPPLIGDQFALSSELQTRSGQHAGWLEAACTVARGGVAAQGPCYGVFLLKGGQLAGITAVPLNGNGNPPVKVAIVGGTGVYEGVTGSVLSISRGENSPYNDDTFHLIWP